MNRNPWIAFCILSATVFMLLVDFSIVSVALPAIQDGLHISQAEGQWLISAYSVLFAGFLLLAGRCADVYGRRRVFFAGIVIFTVSSLVAGLSNSIVLLIVMRATQGIGAAIVNPSALAIVVSMFDDENERSRAVAYWGIVASVGVVAGMVLGGVLVSFFGWRSAFFVNVPVGILVVVFGAMMIPRDQPVGRRGLDPWASIWLTAAMLLLTFTIVRYPSEGISPVTLISGALVLVFFGLYVLVERRMADPLIPPRLFKTQNFTPASLLGMVQAAAYGGIYVFASEFFQQNGHLSPLMTGIVYIPPTLMMSCVAGPLSAPSVQRFGARAVGVFGALCMVAGAALIYAFSGASVSPVLAVLPGLVLGSYGCMTTFEISMIAGLAHVSKSDDAIASATLSTLQETGISLGVALGAALAIAAGSVHAAFVSGIGFSIVSVVCAACIGGIPRIAHMHVRFGKMVHRQPIASESGPAGIIAPPGERVPQNTPA